MQLLSEVFIRIVMHMKLTFSSSAQLAFPTIAFHLDPPYNIPITRVIEIEFAKAFKCFSEKNPIHRFNKYALLIDANPFFPLNFTPMTNKLSYSTVLFFSVHAQVV